MGFSSKGSTYYYIKNDIAFCLSFEKLTGLLYSTFYVMPLYIPCEHMYFTYGNRLNELPNSSVEILHESASDQEINVWFDNLLDILEKIILPFFQSISSPLQLLHFVNHHRSVVNTLFFCPKDQLERLRVFTYLYLNDFSNLKPEIKRAYVSLSCADFYTDELKNKWRSELSRIESYLSDSSFCCSKFCAETIEQTMRSCFG